MSSKFFNYIFLISFIGIFFSCKQPKTGVNYDLLNNSTLEIQEIDFEYFSTKARIQFQDDKNNISASANIRIKKDSIIWFSITPALGIEAARGFITKDSLIMINRLNKEYVKHDFVSLSESFNFNIDYNLIQAMLLGNMPLKKNEDALVSREKKHFLVRQEEGNINADHLISASTMKVERVHMLQEPEGNTLTLQYSNFNMIDQYALPFNTIISLSYKDGGTLVNTHLNIDYIKAEISQTPLSFPFSIPTKYERK